MAPPIPGMLVRPDPRDIQIGEEGDEGYRPAAPRVDPFVQTPEMRVERLIDKDGYVYERNEWYPVKFGRGLSPDGRSEVRFPVQEYWMIVDIIDGGDVVSIFCNPVYAPLAGEDGKPALDANGQPVMVGDEKAVQHGIVALYQIPAESIVDKKIMGHFQSIQRYYDLQVDATLRPMMYAKEDEEDDEEEDEEDGGEAESEGEEAPAAAEIVSSPVVNGAGGVS